MPRQVYTPENSGQIVHSLSLNGDPQPMAITYGIVYDDQVPLTNKVIVDELHDAFGDTIVSLMSNQYVLTQTEAYFWRTPFPSDPEVAVNSTPRTGAINSQIFLPQNSALLVHKRTSVPGRRGRGRFYIPGVQEDHVDMKGELTATYMGSWQTQFNAFLGRFNNGPIPGVRMALLHSYEVPLPDPLPPTAVPAIVDSLQLDKTIATQRRRLRK